MFYVSVLIMIGTAAMILTLVYLALKVAFR